MPLLHFVSALSFLSLAAAWTTYVVPHSGGGDDTPALAAAFKSNPSLATDATIVFQQGLTYNMLTPISFPRLENVLVSIQGNITYAADIKSTQAIVASSDYPGHWFSFNGGTNVTLEGSQAKNWGWVNSNGQLWWNALQEISSQVNRPSGWAFTDISGGGIRYMKLWQPVAWSFAIASCENLLIHDNQILAISDDDKIIPYNTDGFNVQGTNLVFEYNVVYNDDDCIAIITPANGIVFRNGYCHGGYGLSIGGLGKDGASATVENILFESVVVENSAMGTTFKSYAGGAGTCNNVTWSDITLTNVRLPIYISQTYWDQDDGYDSDSSGTTSTHVSSFTFQNFRGTIDDSMGNGVTGSTGKEVVILDVFEGTASSILVKNVSVTTTSGSPVTVMCDPSKVSGDVGFKCWDGLYQPTAAGE